MSELETILISGGDHSLIVRQAQADMGRLSSNADRFSVSIFSETDYLNANGDRDLSRLCEAAVTMPMFGDKRVLIARDLKTAGTSAAVLKRLTASIVSADRSADMVLVWEPPGADGQSKPPKALIDAVKAANGKHIALDGKLTGKKAENWLEAAIEDYSLCLDPAAKNRLLKWIGDDQGKGYGAIETLKSVFAEDRISDETIKPFLQGLGSEPVWKLCDQIDKNNRAEALKVLHALLENGKHPMQIFFALHKHYERFLKLQGAEKEPDGKWADTAGMPHNMEFAAERSKNRAEELGYQNLKAAFGFLTEAESDIKGRSGLPAETVLDVLVARLASQRKWSA